MAQTDWSRLVPELMRYVTVGIELAVIFGVFVFLGIWLDSRTGGGVLFTLLGVVFGFGGSLYRMVRLAQEYQKKYIRKDNPPPSQP